MRADLIRTQIENMEPHRLGYLAGLLSVSLGLKRTMRAFDVLNQIPNSGHDQNEYFSNLICILRIEVTDSEWDRAVELLHLAMPAKSQEPKAGVS